jgi:hypothetical protein
MGTLCPFLIDSSALRPCESYKLGLFSDYGPSAHNTKMPNLNVHGSKMFIGIIDSLALRPCELFSDYGLRVWVIIA